MKQAVKLLTLPKCKSSTTIYYYKVTKIVL